MEEKYFFVGPAISPCASRLYAAVVCQKGLGGVMDGLLKWGDEALRKIYLFWSLVGCKRRKWS